MSQPVDVRKHCGGTHLHLILLPGVLVFVQACPGLAYTDALMSQILQVHFLAMLVQTPVRMFMQACV